MADNLELKACPFCGWPATAMIDTGTKVWRVYCNDDGTCGGDAPGCCAEGPEAMTEAEAIAAWNQRAPHPTPASDGGYVDAFYDLAKMMDIGARPHSAKVTWEREMKPRIAAALAVQGGWREALEVAEVTLRLDGQRMAEAGMSTSQNAEAHGVVVAALNEQQEG